MNDLAIANLKHAVGFLQSAYTIVLALALSEAFKQFVADSGDRKIYWNRTFSLIGFLVQIFPFFHGMSRYLFKTYLAPNYPPDNWPVYLMSDGIVFLLMSGCFFVMSRSLSPDRWHRFYGSTGALLLVDSIWISAAIFRGVNINVWLWLNAILAVTMIIVYFVNRTRQDSLWPPAIYAFANLATTVTSYYVMKDFYFSA